MSEFIGLREEDSGLKARALLHGKKGFVTPTKSFVKIGITKIFCYNKMFGSINKTIDCCGKILVAATKILFVVPNVVAVTKPFFFRVKS